MRHARLGAVLLAGALVAGGCGATDDIDEVRAAIAETKTMSAEFTFEERTEDRVVTVEGRIEDAFRYSATVTMSGMPLYRQVVRDDTVAVRLLSPKRWNPAAGTPLEDLFASGEWVVDPAGAPPVHLAGAEEFRPEDAGEDPLFEGLSVWRYVDIAIQEGVAVSEFNEDALDYIPSEDPFRELVDADQEAGITRYDIVPPFLPRTEGGQGQQGGGNIPGPPVFRKMAIYVDEEGEVVRILERLSFEEHEDIVEAKERGKPESLLITLEALREGRGQNPVRQREMTFRITADDSVSVKMPGNATQANIGALFVEGAFRPPGDAEELKKGGKKPAERDGMESDLPEGLPEGLGA